MRRRSTGICWTGTCVLAAMLLLSACGGSGGGGDDGPTPRVTFMPATVSIASPVNAIVNPSTGLIDDFTVTVSMSNVSAPAYYPAVELTRNGLFDAYLGVGTPSSLPLTLVFQPPSTLAPGTYQDQVVVVACEDIGCKKPIAGARGTLAVTYEITAAAAGNEPSITFSTLSFFAQSLPWDRPVDRILPFSLANFGAIPHVSADHETATIQVINSDVTSTTAGSLEILPTQGRILGNGTFTDVVTVTVCLDIQCVNPIAGSPFAIQYTYTVGDSLSIGGPYGYVLRATNIDAAAGAWDPVSKRFYLAQSSIPSSSVAVLDPETGQAITGGSLGFLAAGATAVSDDGQYLYVGLSDGNVQRLTLPDLANDLVFSVGRDSIGNPRYANDIAVMPGQPGTVAVSYSTYPRSRFGETTGAGLYDDGTQRPDEAIAVANPPAGTLVNVVSFSADGATLFGAGELSSTSPMLFVLPVLASGLGTPTPPVNVRGGRAHPVGDLIFMDGGTVVDTAANDLTQDISPLEHTTDVLPAPDVDRIFVLGSNDFPPGLRLIALDFNDYSIIASIDLPSSVAANPVWGSLVRLANNEIAFRSQNFVVTITGAFVSP